MGGGGGAAGGFRAAHTRTVLIWEYPPLPRVLDFVILD